MNEMQTFTHEEFGTIRMVERDGELWFVLKDVCGALDIGNSRNVYGRLDDDEKGVHQMDTLGGVQSTHIVNESGLYNVVLRSDKPEAKEFKRWITHEVLPSIRKTGSYTLLPTTEVLRRQLTTDDYLRAAAIVSNCRNERLPYVLGFLEQGGFSTPKVERYCAELPAKAVAEAINDAIRNHGFTQTQICNLTGIDKVQIGRYRKGYCQPRPERAELIVKIIKGAIPEPEN